MSTTNVVNGSSITPKMTDIEQTIQSTTTLSFSEKMGKLEKVTAEVLFGVPSPSKSPPLSIKIIFKLSSSQEPQKCFHLSMIILFICPSPTHYNLIRCWVCFFLFRHKICTYEILRQHHFRTLNSTFMEARIKEAQMMDLGSS